MEKVRYICPICDHELVARGYCPSCKKMIKEPVRYKGAYLPNEDNGNYVLNREMPDRERYRTDNTRYQTNYNTIRNTVQASMKNSAANTVNGRTDFGNCGGHKDSDYGIPNVDPHAKNKRSTGIVAAVITFICILLQIIFSFID